MARLTGILYGTPQYIFEKNDAAEAELVWSVLKRQGTNK